MKVEEQFQAQTNYLVKIEYFTFKLIKFKLN